MIPRAKEGSKQLLLEIAKRTEAEVTDLPVYETVYEPARFLPEHMDMAVFTSASTVRGFAQAVSQQSGNFPDISNIYAVCIGRQTEAAARELGMNTITAKEATIDSLVECCIAYAGQAAPR